MPAGVDAADVAGQGYVRRCVLSVCHTSQTLSRGDQQRFQAQAAAEIGAALPSLLYPLMADEQVRPAQPANVSRSQARLEGGQRVFIEPLVRRLAAFVRDAAPS